MSGNSAAVTCIKAHGNVMDPCEVLTVAMLLAECDEKGSAKRIAYELGGTEAVHTYSDVGPCAMAQGVGESHVFDYLTAHPELVERAGCEVVIEPAPKAGPRSRSLSWDDMQPRLAAVGLADFPEPQPRTHAVYVLKGPDGEWADRDCMSVDDALDLASLLFAGADAEVSVCEKVPLRAFVDADDVVEDVLECISCAACTDDYENIFDGVTRSELDDLSRRLTACFNAWLEDSGNALCGRWYGTGERRFRRAFDGAWEEVA